MATNKQIIEALRVVRNHFPSNSSYVGVHRNVVSISNGHSVMSSDIREISAVISNGKGNVVRRDGNGNNK
jgi:hypothetical protein